MQLDLVLSVTYSIDVRWQGSQRLPPVQLDGFGTIQFRDVKVRIHSYQDIGHIGLQEAYASTGLVRNQRKLISGKNTYE